MLSTGPSKVFLDEELHIIIGEELVLGAAPVCTVTLFPAFDLGGIIANELCDNKQ